MEIDIDAGIQRLEECYGNSDKNAGACYFTIRAVLEAMRTEKPVEGKEEFKCQHGYGLGKCPCVWCHNCQPATKTEPSQEECSSKDILSLLPSRRDERIVEKIKTNHKEMLQLVDGNPQMYSMYELYFDNLMKLIEAHATSQGKCKGGKPDTITISRKVAEEWMKLCSMWGCDFHSKTCGELKDELQRQLTK